MKKRICLIFCFLLLIGLSLFFGKYSNNFIPISLNTYQALLNKKDVSMSNFKIKIPKRWFIAKTNRDKMEILISNVPSLLEKDYLSYFVSIKEINITSENNYKSIIKLSQPINHFFCRYDNIHHTVKCLSNEKNGRVLYLFAKDCDLNSFHTLVKKIDIK